VAVLVGLAVAVTLLLDRLASRLAHGRPSLVAACLWAALGGRSLTREGMRLRAALDAGTCRGRERLPALVGRDPSALDAADICRASIESIAENTGDAVVGPLVWCAIGGATGAVGYRAINTLDAMWAITRSATSASGGRRRDSTTSSVGRARRSRRSSPSRWRRPRAARRPGACACSDATGAATRVRTPDGWRRRSPARWTSASAGATCMGVASRSVRSSATEGLQNRPTWPARRGCRCSLAPPRRMITAALTWRERS